MGADLAVTSPLRDDLATVRRAAERGAELIGKLLAFGRQQRLEKRAVDLSALILEFGGMMRRMVREDIEIRTMLEPGTTVWADPGAMEQILMNLVTNARDAMPGGGLLLIQCRRCSLDWTSCSSLGWGRPGDYVVVSVGDTGSGMDRDTQKHIFEPFFTTKSVGQGTGLGLAVAYGLVRQHEGSMHVYSELSHGTTIKLYFPVVAMAADGGAAAPALPPVRGGTETILLVEDEEAIRRTAARILTRSGYTVVACRDGVEALEVYGTRGPEISLILTDVVMPRMGGPHLVASIREGGHEAKALFTSGYTARDVAETRLLEPDAPFLSKPWTLADLLRKVREVLDAD
jgi:two-component system cell cycle sensor histidine kinase/response regulator CckA